MCVGRVGRGAEMECVREYMCACECGECGEREGIHAVP
jgi:hypothetical protein